MFFDISRWLRDECLDTIWECHSSGPPQKKQKSIFWLAQARALFLCFNISTYPRNKCYGIVWGVTPRGFPQNGPPKKFIFCLAQTRLPVFFDINRYLTDTYFDILWGCHLPQRPPQSGPPKKSVLWTTTFTIPVFLISVNIWEANILPSKRTPKD